MNYAIPKLSQDAVINFEKKGHLHQHDITLFLNTADPAHKGAQTIEDMLNDENLFIPILIKEEDNQLSLFNKKEISYIQTSETEELHTDKSFKVIFSTGDSLMVNSCEILPEFHARPIDYLNSDHQFLTFQNENRKIYINKDKIKRITEL